MAHPLNPPQRTFPPPPSAAPAAHVWTIVWERVKVQPKYELDQSTIDSQLVTPLAW